MKRYQPYILSFVLGICLIAMLVLYMLKTTSDQEAYDSFSNQLIAMRRMIEVSGAMTYGTITSIDFSSHTIQLQFKDRFNELQPYVISLFIPTSTPLFAQSLIRSSGGNGPYDSLSSMTPISIFDLRQGEHAAVLVSKKASAPTADYIIAGEPI